MTETDESSTTQQPGRWLLTHAHLRAIVVAALGTIAGLIAARPDVLVLVVPLLLAAVWSIIAKPTGQPWATGRLARDRVAEGESNAVIVRAGDMRGGDFAAVSLAPMPWVQRRPDHGSRVAAIGGGGAEAHFTLGADPQRWGDRKYGATLVGAVGPWAAYVWGPVPLAGKQRPVTPAAEPFDSGVPAPHPRGVVGHHRASRPGQGSEFSSIRPFQWGDRLKNINWPRSLRSSELHVTSTHADQDTHVALILDAQSDLGSSEGIGTESSTLDRSVRAAAAIGEHFALQGDRVSLQIMSGAMPKRLMPGSGPAHFRRLLDVLGGAVPAPEREIDPAKIRLGLRAGTLVVIVSSFVSEGVLVRAAALARSGLTVVAVDVLGETQLHNESIDVPDQLAWRVRMLEREREIRRVTQAGVSLVPWRGPGSLDMVLRMLTRRGSAGMV